MGDSNKEDVPETTITKELLKEAVRLEKGTDEVVILDFKTKAGSKKGDNYTSIITAAEVKAKVRGEIETCHYIVKELPADPTRRKWLEHGNIFEMERDMYGTIMPALMDVQKQHGVKNPMSVDAPKMYSSTKNTDWIVFENLTIQGYKLANRYTGLDYDHCRVALKALGMFHALSYALRRNTNQHLEEAYPWLEDKIFGKAGEEMFREFVSNSYDMTIKTVGMVDSALAEKMKPLRGNIPVYQKCRDIRYNTEGLEVICHGDFWVNNMMFKYEKKGDVEVPVAVKMVDFQFSRVASPTMDLQYFFNISTTRETRQKHLSDLLKFYHDTFTNTLHSMGLEFEEFTYQRLCDKYEKDRLFGYYYVGCFTLPFLMTSPNESFSMEDLPDVDVSGMSDAFTDQMEKCFSKMKDSKHPFLDRLKGIVLDLEEAGFL